jgi:hypothetical protein
MNSTFLPDTESSVNRLSVCGWIPGWIDQNHPISTGQIQADTADASSQQHALEAVTLVVKFVNLRSA